MDAADAVTLESKGKAEKDYTKFLDKNALKGKRIGIEKSFLKGRHEGVVALYQQAIEEIKKQGATIIEIDLLKETNPLGGAEFTILQFEFKDGLNKYFASANAPIKTMADLIAFNKKEEATAMPYFKQETIESSQAKSDLNSKEYTDALQKTLTSRKIIDSILQQNKLDAIVGTSIGPATPIDLINGDSDAGFYFCPPAAMAGYPHITVPMGDISGLSVGLSFVASAYQEATIIAFAYAYEQATNKRKAPKFLSTLYPN